jgi:hypothetical protein
MRPNFDSIALPLARFIRDEAERRARALEARQVDLVVAAIDDLTGQIQTRIDEIKERLIRLESTEVRSTDAALER